MILKMVKGKTPTTTTEDQYWSRQYKTFVPEFKIHQGKQHAYVTQTMKLKSKRNILQQKLYIEIKKSVCFSAVTCCCCSLYTFSTKNRRSYKLGAVAIVNLMMHCCKVDIRKKDCRDTSPALNSRITIHQTLLKSWSLG